MTTQNTTTQPLPLYKRLNKQRTEGEWVIGRNAINDYSDDDGRTFRKGEIYLSAPTWSDFSLFYRHEIDESDTETEANAQYTALAVNNLAALAEALENLHSACMNGDGIHVEWWNKNKETVAKAKEALARIS